MDDALDGFVPFVKGPLSTTTSSNGKIKNEFTKKPGAYIATIIKSGKQYVGSSGNLAKRVNYNLSTLENNKHNNKKLQEAYNENPEVSIVVKTTRTTEQARQLEQRVVDELSLFGNLCNEGTDDVSKPATGLVRSEETKQKISATRKEYFSTDEGKIALAQRAEKVKQAIIINSVTYSSMTEAAKALGVSKQTITNRCRSDDYPDYNKLGKNS